MFKLEEDESESDEIDYEKSLRKMASNVMLKISSLLKLVHMNNGGEPSKYKPFSLEAALHGGRDDMILSAKLIRIAPETSSF